ncbi:class II aldolase/adducin family protein [Nitratireductor basaltis]|uniref:Ribulose-5-phosphate 4-epimerase-like epimerase or aldolase n=1 Tax=Nitratireductor basaltis TaxID=472175 RepID=A0A084U7R9_9HYPH|nr:class II aldolase/adducin family protein [Nitratireductor basaltis]KFB09005.1 Ribulose-5-phosphate 4-epimerase-like epimerase or aldolase [Nitratireductor basaltis]
MTTTTSARKTVFEELVTATKILLHEGILDTFGHISARDPEDPKSFFLAQKLAPSHITVDDMQRFDLDGETDDPRPSYLERYIHSEIYKARPDVNCVLHSHSPAVLPYCFTDQPLRPVTHMGAFLGETVPVYEIRDKQGDATDLFGGSREVCADIAESLGDQAVVLMARHGVVNVGGSVREVVFRAFYTEQNAAAQTAGLQVGKIEYLSPGEVKTAGKLVGAQIDRGWDHWTMRLRQAGLLN